jgi:hypothetical protein
MKPIKTSTTNCILKGTTPDVMDLPVSRFDIGKGITAVQSCWQLDEKELEKINKTGKVYFSSYGETHPPICLSVEPMCKEGES